MKIRSKVVLFVLPLIVTPLVLYAVASALSARNGITEIAQQFLQFKGQELQNYAASQWELLEQNDLTDDESLVRAAKSAVTSFAQSVVRSETELILAVDDSGEIAMQTGDVELTPAESETLRELYDSQTTGWQEVDLGGVARLGHSFFFEPFGWYVLVTEARQTFFHSVNEIIRQSAMFALAASVIAVFLLLQFSRVLTRPLRGVVSAMRGIIQNNDFSRRVELLYADEIGEMAHTFNIMTEEIQRAYEQIKSYAYQAVVSRKREQKIRHIFQKYVPHDVIDQFFKNPEAMLVGENRDLSVLFSDVRGFTSLSETLKPNEVVESLNTYFEIMVDLVTSRKGIVDKYIGDAIMAFFGAPVRHEDDTLEAVTCGLDMLDALTQFNERQLSQGRPEFKIGIGVNYGPVTVGNIGSEKKMDYTVIGDMVNLASRLEGLTKYYKEPFIVSESVREQIDDAFAFRFIDRVAVKGRKRGIGIFAPRRDLTPTEEEAWELHRQGIGYYYERHFERAAEYFERIRSILPSDEVSRIFLERSRRYAEEPPGEDWTGVHAMVEK